LNAIVHVQNAYYNSKDKSETQAKRPEKSIKLIKTGREIASKI
jgi:hypothetical protein